MASVADDGYRFDTISLYKDTYRYPPDGENSDNGCIKNNYKEKELCNCERKIWNRQRRRMVVESTIICFFLLAMLPAPTEGRRPHLRYMTNHCSDRINLYTSLLVDLTPPTSLSEVRDDPRHCKVVVRTVTPGARVMLHFLQLGISADHDHHDSVKIFDSGPELTELTPKAGLYGVLDRSEMIEDTGGYEVKDYLSTGNEITIDYVGIPTLSNFGFRILVTSIQSPDGNGQCPDRTLRCPQATRMCIPATSVCDGYDNCGLDDPGDERNCGNFDTVTDLMDSYSLVYDILVVTLLPVITFILLALLIYCAMKHYIRIKITIRAEPPVIYRAANGGQAKLKLKDNTRLYAPPSYEDVVNPSGSVKGGAKGVASTYAPPPAYSSLPSLVRAGEVEVIDSEEDGSRLSTPEHRRRRDRRGVLRLTRDANYDSTSSLDDNMSSPRRNGRLHKDAGKMQGRGSRDTKARSRDVHVNLADTDDEEDKAAARRNRKKGGKAKKTVCPKRRADDLISDIPGNSDTMQKNLDNVACLKPEEGKNIGDLCSNDNSLQNNSYCPTHHQTSFPNNTSSLPTYDDLEATPASNQPSSKIQTSSLASDLSDEQRERLAPSHLMHGGKSSGPKKREAPAPPYDFDQVNQNSSLTRLGKTGLNGTSARSSPLKPKQSDLVDPRDPVPCVVEITASCSPSSDAPLSQQSPAHSSSPSPSSSSSAATDPDTTGQHSGTESRVASNPDSRTESNGSIADQLVSPPAKRNPTQYNQSLSDMCARNSTVTTIV